MRTELMPNETELSRINALTPVDLERDQVAVLPALAIDQQLTAYDTKIDESWMTKAAQDANGEEGVSFLKHHDKNSDPVGRVFFAEIDKSDSKNLRLLVKAFTANQDVAEDYATARFKAVSALVASSWLKCGACGNEWLSDECLQAAEDKKHEAPESSWYRWLFGKYVHVPGVEYDKEKCFLWHMADMDDQHSGMLELSMVYKGASAGKLLKKTEFAREIRAKMSDNRKEAKGRTIQELEAGKRMEMRDNLRDHYKLIGMQLAMSEPAENGGEPDPPAEPPAPAEPAASEETPPAAESGDPPAEPPAPAEPAPEPAAGEDEEKKALSDERDVAVEAANQAELRLVEEEKKCAKLAAELSASKGEVADLKAKLEADGEKFALLKTECEECAHSWNTLRERIVGMCARFETKLGGARKEDDFKALTDEKLVESFMLLDDKVRQYGSGTPRPITERIRPMKPACSVGGRKRLPDHVCEVS